MSFTSATAVSLSDPAAKRALMAHTHTHKKKKQGEEVVNGGKHIHVYD